MDVEFADPRLQRLEQEATYTAGFDEAVVKAYRKRLQYIRAAADERDFYSMRSLHYEKLRGDREGQRSMRLKGQWRLVLRVADRAAGKRIVIIEIVDYH